MKQETSEKKKKLWLWILLGAVALLAVVGVVLALVLGGDHDSKKEPEKIQSELYWNVDRQDVLDEKTGLSAREKNKDGEYMIRFATGGKQVELPTTDKKLVNVIDTMDIMGLKLDADGYIIDVYAPEEFCSKVVDQVYVQKIDGNTVTVNTANTFDGVQTVLTLGDDLGVYNVSSLASMCGQKDALEVMDTITIYGPDENTPDEVFILNRIWESEAYWRLEQKYNSSKKATSREKAEDGYWYVDFAVRGEQVTLRTKSQEVINAIDGYSILRACCGLVFDDQGDIVDCFSAALAKRGVYTADGYDITELSEDGKTFTATRIMFNAEVGKTYTGTVTEDTEIYNVNSTADMIGEVTNLQMGDRIVAVKDGDGNPVLIYVINRRVDSPLYYNVSKSYSSALKKSTRTPDENGWYTIKLAANGKEVTYKTKDVNIVNKLDGYNLSLFGLKVQNGIIVKVYDAVCVTGNYSFASNCFVTSIAGPVISATSTSGTTSNGVMSADCEVYDMSGNGKFKGVATTLREGDRIIGYTNPEGEVCYIAIIGRYESGTTLYWNTARSGVSNGKTTRAKDADGYYNFKVIKVGTTTVTTVRTKSDDIAYRMDSQSQPPAFAIRLSGDIVTAAYSPESAIGGYRTLNYVHVESANEDGSWACSARTTGATATFRPADVTKYYNFSGVYNDKAGERYSGVKVNDQISCIANKDGQIEYCFLVSRKTDTKLYFNKSRKYNSTTGETTRVPDAEGYYVFELAVDGEVKTFRTKSKDVATAVDANALAFGLKLSGDIIQNVYPAGAAKDVKQSASGSYYDVEKIEGNKLYLKRNRPGQTDTGKEVTLTLASNYKVYNLSPGIGDEWGTATKLDLGDRIHAYINDDDKVTYIYIMYECTHEGGGHAYCSHCGKVVWWENMYAGIQYKTDLHSYVPRDMETANLYNWIATGDNGESFDYVLDLNGRTITRTATNGVGSGGVFRVANGNTLTVLDTTKNPGTIRTDLNGITYKDSAMYGLMMVAEKSTLVIDGNITVDASTATSTYNKANAGVIAVGGKLVINSGTFYGFKEMAGNGGLIGGWNGSDTVINGGTFYPGTSKLNTSDKPTGSGGIVCTNGTLTINGGKFVGYGSGTAGLVANGGLICANGPSLVINGGTFSGGNTTGWGPNIYYYRQCKINGTAVVGGGSVTIGGNANILGGLTIRGTKDAKVKITTKGQATVDLSTEDATLGRWYNYRVENGEMYINDETTPRKTTEAITNFSVLKNCKDNVADVVDGVSNETVHNYNDKGICSDCGHDKNATKNWTKADSLPTSGNWKLATDVTVTTQTHPTGDLYIDLNGHNITLNAPASNGSVGIMLFKVDKAVKLTITDTSNDANGGKPGTVSAVYPAGAKLSTYAPLICGSVSGSEIVLMDGIYDASNIECTYTSTSGAIVVGGKLTVSGSTTVIKGMKSTTGNGTAIGAWGGSNVTINDGTFTGGTAKNGGLFACNGNLTITGGDFTGGKAENGGIIVSTSSSDNALTITGGTFTSGTATKGSGIYVNSANCDVKLGGTATFDGGVYLENFKSATLTDTVKVSKNSECGLKIASGKLVNVTGLDTTAAKIVVNAQGVFTTELSSGEAAEVLLNNKILVSGEDGVSLIISNKQIQMGSGTTPAPEPATLNIEDQAWQDWTSETALPTSGKYRLTKAVTLSKCCKLTGDLMLDLNGFTVTRNVAATETAEQFAINTNAFDLIIEDNSGNDEATLGCIKTVPANGVTFSSWAGVIYAPGDSKVTINNGIIDGSAVTSTLNTIASGTITAANNADGASTLTINGGIIKGQRNTSKESYKSGSCVGAWKNANVIINGGKLIAPTSTGSNDYVCCTGSCINAAAGGTITINGGTLLGNRAMNHGGTICTEGNLVITGGFITGGYSTNSGNIQCCGTMTVTGGVILNGKTAASGSNNRNGANIDKVGGTLTIGGDAVIGGGICIRSDATLKLQDKPVINSNLNAEQFFDIRIIRGTVSVAGTDYTTEGKYKVVYGSDGKVASLATYAAPLNYAETDVLPTTGNIKLTENVTVSAQVKLTGDLTIDLNGHTITYAPAEGATYNHLFEVRDGKTLVLTDSSATPGTVKVGSEATTTTYAGLIYTNNNASVVIQNITLDGSNVTSTKTDGGGTIMVGANTNLTVVNAKLKGLKKMAAGGTVISGWSSSNVMIYGDDTVITAGEAGGNGASISTTGKITINGGTFVAGTLTGGTNSTGNSQIYNKNSLTINGGTFTAPTSGVKHAGVILMDAGTLTINGGTFTGGTVAANGGIINSNGKIVINGGVFKAGKARQGGILFQSGTNCTLTITGGVFVGPGNNNDKGCTNGGLLALNVPTVTITGGRFYNGYATSYGCNIYSFRAGSTMTLGGDAYIGGEIRALVSSGDNMKLVLKDSVKIDITDCQPNTKRNLYLSGTDVYITDTTGTAVATVATDKNIKYNPSYDANGAVTGVTVVAN